MSDQLPVRIVVADDHPLFREGLRCLLASEPGFEVVGEAADGQAALEQCAALAPDILLLDVEMPRMTGLEVLANLPGVSRETAAVLVTGTIERRTVLEAVMRGARGVVLKTDAPDLLVTCLREVAAGGYWVEQHAFNDLVAALNGRRPPTPPDQSDIRLTPRERQIILAITDGATNADIGRTLGLRDQTVKNHLSRIYEKVGVANRLELALFAINHGLGSAV